MPAKKTKTKGRDVAAPVRVVRFGDQEYKLVFNNRTAMIVEEIYDKRYGLSDKGYYDVLTEIGVPKHRALMAICYAAIIVGGGKVTWEAFEDAFELTDIVGLREELQSAVLESLPPAEEGSEGKKQEAPGTGA